MLLSAGLLVALVLLDACGFCPLWARGGHGSLIVLSGTTGGLLIRSPVPVVQ
jgi:hypothetical protein